MSCVYAIQDTNGLLKLGVAKDPELRLKQLQTGNGVEVKSGLIVQPVCKPGYHMWGNGEGNYPMICKNGGFLV